MVFQAPFRLLDLFDSGTRNFICFLVVTNWRSFEWPRRATSISSFSCPSLSPFILLFPFENGIVIGYWCFLRFIVGINNLQRRRCYSRIFAFQSCWVFEWKTNHLGGVVKTKARLVAKGYSQRERCWLFQDLPPTPTPYSVRLIASVAVENDMGLDHFDAEQTRNLILACVSPRMWWSIW